LFLRARLIVGRSGIVILQEAITLFYPTLQ
jgi:hypothetical protein